MIYTLEGSFGKRFTATIFEHGDSPLRVIAVKLTETGESDIPRITIEGSQPALNLALQRADEFLRERRLPNVYIQRNVRAYIGNTIHVVKPDQQRYWTRASALRDADEIYVDIMQAWRSISMSLHDLIGPQPLQPIELSRALGPDGVRRLLELIRDAYFDLVQSRKVNRSMDENQITEELYVHILKYQRLSGVLPSVYVVHEKQDRTQAKNTREVSYCGLLFPRGMAGRGLFWG